MCRLFLYISTYLSSFHLIVNKWLIQVRWIILLELIGKYPVQCPACLSQSIDHGEIYMYKAIILLAVLLLASPCWAGETAAAADKPSLYTSQTVTLTATVEAINHETREVTLRGPEGRTVDIVASEEARNLDQVGVGDILNIEYEQSMSIEVFAADNAEAGAGALTAAARTDEGEMPGLVAIDAVVITAIVEEINIEANTFKLRGPQGNVKEYEARYPENLKKAAVGDIVVITFTEAIAASVMKVDAK
jgi:hypothetical protein